MLSDRHEPLPAFLAAYTACDVSCLIWFVRALLFECSECRIILVLAGRRVAQSLKDLNHHSLV